MSLTHESDATFPEGERLTSTDFLTRSQEARERGHFADALTACRQAFMLFVEEGDHPKASETMSSEGLTWRHLFEKEKDEAKKVDFGARAEGCQTTALRILEGHNINERYKALYELGKLQQTLGRNEEAFKNYEAAIANFKEFPGQFRYADSVMAEMETRLYALQYSMGDKTSFSKWEDAQQRLKEAENQDDYTKNVWVSGGYMHMAEALIGSDNDKARSLLADAMTVIGDNEAYALRGRQIEALLERTTQ